MGWIALLLFSTASKAKDNSSQPELEIASLGSQNIRKFIMSDILYDPQPTEGYFQGWNLGFSGSGIQIFSTMLVSNLGPNSLNNGVSVVIYLPGQSPIFLTQEWGEKDWIAKKDELHLVSGKNSIQWQKNKLNLHFEWEDFLLELQYYAPLHQGVSLTGGRLPILKQGSFLRADVPFSFSDVDGSLYYQGETYSLKGKGGLEHLNTNLEVYRYSRYWEIARFYLPTGERLLLGGFVGNSRYSGGSFRQFAILGQKGEIVKGGAIESWEILKTEKNQISGAVLPSLQKFQSKDCVLLLDTKKSIAEINILSNISAVLRFFIRVFFAKPYMIHKEAKLSVQCNDLSSTKENILSNESNWEGIHSYYLINH